MIDRWLDRKAIEVGPHTMTLFSESPGGRDSVSTEIQETFRDHYIPPKTWSEWTKALQAPETAKLLQDKLPTTKQARSGDTGEILATEIAEQELKYEVPIRRIRWKDGRNVALQGDDILGVTPDSRGKLAFLKGEAKSRSSLSSNVVKEAADTLDSDMGRPSRFSAIFTAQKLSEQNREDLATKIVKALSVSFEGHTVEHMLFVVSGNDPENFLGRHLSEVEPEQPKRYAVGFRIPDHGDFIEGIFEGF